MHTIKKTNKLWFCHQLSEKVWSEPHSHWSVNRTLFNTTSPQWNGTMQVIMSLTNKEVQTIGGENMSPYVIRPTRQIHRQTETVTDKQTLPVKTWYNSSYTCVVLPITLSFPHFWSWQKCVYQSVQRHTGLTHPFRFSDIRALWRSVLSSQSERVPECQKIKDGGLHQYGAEHFKV